MKVVLAEDVKDLGKRGEVKEVADGYARNYLLPRKLAVPATAAQLNQIKQQSEAAQRRASRQQADQQALGQRIEATEVQLTARVGDQGRLFGSITSADIADKLSAALGIPIDKRQINLPDPIKQAGTHKVTIHLGRGTDATATVVVQPEAT